MADKSQVQRKTSSGPAPPPRAAFSRMTLLDIAFDFIAIAYVLGATSIRLLSTPAQVAYAKATNTLSHILETLHAATEHVHQKALATRTQLKESKVSTGVSTRLSPSMQDTLLFVFAPILITYHAIHIHYHTIRHQVHDVAADYADRAKDCLHIILHVGQPERYQQMEVQLQYLRKQVTVLGGEVEEKGKHNRRLESAISDLKMEIQAMKDASAEDNESKSTEQKRLEEACAQLKAELEETKKASKEMESLMEKLQEKIETLEEEKEVAKKVHVEVGVDAKVEEPEPKAEPELKKEEEKEEKESVHEKDILLKVPETPMSSLPLPKPSLGGSLSADHRRTVSFSGHHRRAETEPADAPRSVTPPASGSTRRVSTTSTRSRRRSFMARVRSGLGLPPRKDE